MKTFSKLRLFLLFAVLSFCAGSAQAQFGANTYGGQTDPYQIIAGRYAGQSASFDSLGRLSGNGAGSASYLVGKVRTISLSSAQIKTLNSVPDTLAPTPPAGYYNFMGRVLVSYTYGTTPYTGDSVMIAYSPGSSSFYKNGSILTATANAYAYFGNVNGAELTTVGGPILIGTGTSDPAAGDGTMLIQIFYFVLPIPVAPQN